MRIHAATFRERIAAGWIVVRACMAPQGRAGVSPAQIRSWRLNRGRDARRGRRDARPTLSASPAGWPKSWPGISLASAVLLLLCFLRVGLLRAETILLTGATV